MTHRGQKLFTSKTGRIYECKPVTIIMTASCNTGEDHIRTARTVLTEMRYSTGSAADPVDWPVGYDIKHIAEVAFRIHAVQFARTGQAVQQCSAFTTMVGAEEQEDGMTFI